jgi:AbrB family transcriptional regulator (stage V sporulation protein T)
MKTTGIVRRIDDLGRVAIPKEIRRTLRIREGDPLEIFVQDDGIFFKKYSPLNNLDDFAQKYSDSIYKTLGNICFITDRDDIIAVSGIAKKNYLAISISEEIQHIMKDKKFIAENNNINLINNQPDIFKSTIIAPIIAEGDVMGTVILVSTSSDMGSIETKVAESAATFLGKQLED